ncbi:MAG: HD domain-containing protein [candidate division WOR-3 bacterium]|nr:HD domain-containing protein [candidate division WOR-3 bacterium]
MKSQYINELKSGQLVKEKFLLTKKILKEKKDGGFFTQIELSDRTGSIEGVAWDNVSDELKNISSGDFVFVTGTVTEYNEKPRIVVNSITRVSEEEIEAEDFLPVAEENIDDVVAEIIVLLNGITNPYLKDLIQHFLNDKEIIENFKRAPAAKKAHHAEIGGLAVHTRNVMKLGMKACEIFKFLNADLVVAGSFLHDIGKIYEYTYQKKIDHTKNGRMLGHIIIGYEMITEKISKIEKFPEELRLKLLHMVVSHHGELEYGSPILPLFPEALILHFLDNLDSKLEMMHEEIKKNKGTLADWSEYHPLLERVIYLGTEI